MILNGLLQRMSRYAVCLIFLFYQHIAIAEEKKSPKSIQQAVLGMNVSGTQDLPNVLYIIPWKNNFTQASSPNISRLVDEIYAPVDPEVFSKQVNFYYQLMTKELAQQSAQERAQPSEQTIKE